MMRRLRVFHLKNCRKIGAALSVTHRKALLRNRLRKAMRGDEL
jgi:hypothetical protein